MTAPDAQATADSAPAVEQAGTRPLLEISDLYVHYGGILALQDIDMAIYPSEVVTLIGANGAGKSTTLRSISRLINPRSGQIIYDGQTINRRRPHEAVQMGIAQVPEGRRMLTRQSVLDNLRLGAYTRSDSAAI